jgi:nitrogen regulatory protein PII
MTATSMRLLVAVVHDPEKLDEILSGFLEIGITGATVLSSEGMGSLLSHDIPLFAGLQTLVSGSRPQNRLILSVISQDHVQPVVDLLTDVAVTLARRYRRYGLQQKTSSPRAPCADEGGRGAE